MRHVLHSSTERLAIIVIVLAVAGISPAAAQQMFLPDDPLMADPDQLDTPVPAGNNPSDMWDFVEHTLVLPAEHEGPALNVNTLGNVPNSSWYQKRHFWDRMTLEELKHGADAYAGRPSKEGPWTVVAGKEEGKAAGFQIVDVEGNRYFFKFDAASYIEGATGAEAIVTKFFHALGYWVPQNNVVRFSADRLVPDEDNTIPPEQIQEILARAPRYPDGDYRALASLFISAEEILGPFEYYGTRPDDGNDIFPHELRRELRGMKIFAAWLRHEDSRSLNSLDAVKEIDGRTFVRHYLLDFGSTLGSGPFGPKDRWTGFQYALDPGAILLRAVSLGFAGSEWWDIEYPGYPSVGHFTAKLFDPAEWKPQYLNPAFVRMDLEDAFWAAKQVMHFTDEEIRALVSSGRYTNPDAEEYLAETIIVRRDIIGETYLWLGGGLARFEVEDGRLVFEDLPANHDLVAPGATREIEWRTFENDSSRAGSVIQSGTMAGTSIEIPASGAAFLQVDIRTRDYGLTRVWLRAVGGGYELAGLDREPGTFASHFSNR